MITLNSTIKEGKEWLRSRLRDGAACPVCRQHAQMYRRKVNSGMARSLIHMYRLAGTGWVHVSVIGARSREEGKLKYWSLVEEQQANGLHGGRAGYWRVTPAGESFLKETLKIPKYAKVYNGRCYGMEGPLVGIREALGTKFDYNDLMNGV